MTKLVSRLVLSNLLKALTIVSITFVCSCTTVADNSVSADDKLQLAKIRLELATNYFLDSKFDIALQEVNSAIKAANNYADAYSLRGLIYMQLVNYHDAEQDLLHAIKLTKSAPDILHNYALLLCRMHRLDEANSYFAKVLNSPSYNRKFGSYLAQGICNLDNGNMSKAKQSLNLARELEPNHPQVIYELARFEYVQKNYLAAINHIKLLNSLNQFSAKSLWLGMQIAYKLSDSKLILELASLMQQHYPGAIEMDWYNTKQFERSVLR